MQEEKKNGIANMLEEIHSSTQTLEEEIDEKIKEAKLLLTRHGGTAKISLTIEIKKIDRYDNFFDVSAETKLKAPKMPKKGIPMFGDRDGFSAEHPEQKTIFDEMKPAAEPASVLAKSTTNVSTLKKG